MFLLLYFYVLWPLSVTAWQVQLVLEAVDFISHPPPSASRCVIPYQQLQYVTVPCAGWHSMRSRNVGEKEKRERKRKEEYPISWSSNKAVSESTRPVTQCAAPRSPFGWSLIQNMHILCNCSVSLDSRHNGTQYRHVSGGALPQLSLAPPANSLCSPLLSVPDNYISSVTEIITSLTQSLPPTCQQFPS